MKILFITNVPAPYRVDFFNELGMYCDLTVVFQKKTSDERDKSWSEYKFKNFKGVLLRGISLNTDTAFCPQIIKYVSDNSYDKIINCAFTNITGMMAIQWMKLLHKPYYLECDGGIAKNGIGIKERIKKHFISGAQGYLSTGNDCDRYYCTYGADKSKIFRYPFTSIRESDIICSPTDETEKKIIRKELGIKEKQIILTVGQFIYRKGFDILLNLTKYFSEDIGVYFVGGCITKEYQQIVNNNNISNAHFVNFVNKNELKKYYKAADVFVFPTREDIWGLVINEAMAQGLPVVCSNKCLAGLELVRNGYNGYIVNIDKSDEIVTAIQNAFIHKNEFANKSLEIIKEYTIENMAQRHYDILCS